MVYRLLPECKVIPEGNGGFIYNSANGQVKAFNEVGALVIPGVEIGETLEILVERLAVHFPEVDRSILVRDVRAFVESLNQEGVLCQQR